MHSYVYSETLGDGDGEREILLLIFKMETGTINNVFIGQ
jgi:hypothetical protein